MVGPHRVNLAEVRKFNVLEPWKPSEEQHKELVEDLVEVSIFEEKMSKICKISLALTGQLRKYMI